MLNLEYCVGLSIFLYCFSVKKLPAEPVSSRVASASSLKRVNSVLCHVWFANRTHQNTEFTVMNDNLSHTSWKCKYHIVFAPKYRRKNIYGALKTDIGRILRQLCELKKVEIHEAKECRAAGIIALKALVHTTGSAGGFDFISVI